MSIEGDKRRRWGRFYYWRHWRPFRWWFIYVNPEKCMSCGRRWREHKPTCYFAAPG